MNKTFNAFLLVAVSLSSVASVKAESYGDLIVGFTTQSGNDHLLDLGPATSLANGQTWNLATLLSGVNLTTVNWGVIGNAGAADSFLPNFSGVNTYWLTTSGPAPAPANKAQFNAADTGINSILQNFPGGIFNSQSGDTLTIVNTDPNSWNGQTISGTPSSAFVNAILNPNVAGQATASFWQVQADGSNPVHPGNFTLSASGVLTYSTLSVVSAPVAGFSSTPVTGFAPLKVVFGDTSTGTITNWLWTFGDGHTLTNTVSRNATNSYATAGTYTVSLKATGPGGNNTITKSALVVVSPTPSLGKLTLVGSSLVFGGTNCPAGVQYRILSTTNLNASVATWTPVFTNTFSASGTFGYTNNTAKAQAYFQLVSP